MESTSMYSVGNVYAMKVLQRSKVLSTTTLTTMFTVFRIALDTAAVVGSVALAYSLRFADPTTTERPPLSIYISIGLLLSLALYVVNNWRNLHQPRRGASRIDEVFAVSGSLILSHSFVIMFSFFYREISLSRLTYVYFLVFSLGLVAAERIVLSSVERTLRARGWGLKRLLIVGSGTSAEILLDKISLHPEMGIFLLGYLKNGGRDVLAKKITNHGNVDDLPSVLETFDVDEVIVALPSNENEKIHKVISTCEERTVECKLVPDFYELMKGPARTDDLMGIPIISIKETPLRGVCLLGKRAFDVAFSGIMMVLLSPILGTIALAVRLDSEGPILYKQERVGLNGKTFDCLKFRSMTTDAEEKTGPIWATNGDPRTTRFGAFIRRYSLDELPQLWNIFIGEMSLIGPRPERPYFVNIFTNEIPRYMDRHRVPPGLTGWAQVNGLRGRTSIIERTKFDLYYIDNWSAFMEMKIFIKTFLEVVMQRNAY